MLTEQQKSIFDQFRNANRVEEGRYSGLGRQFKGVADLTPEEVFRMADELARSPEDFTDLTGVKLGQQRG
jgi:hypothetical protein